MRPDQQALIGVIHLEAAVLDVIGDGTLTRRQIHEALFPEGDRGSTEIVEGILWRLCWSGQLKDDQDADRQHYRYTRA